VRFDLSAFSAPARQLALEEESARLQRTLDIQNGPLLRAAWFDFGPNGPAHFLLILHHLVMDVVSWPILMDSLETAYSQICQGRRIDLGPKTTSFAQWADLLNDYAQSSALQSELSYWLCPDARDVRPLPVDFPQGENTEASADRVLTNLDSATTKALLFDLPKKWSMQVHEILLAALARALARWTGHDKVLIHVEGHGRELLFDEVDLTRTIGWFTSVSPLLLNLEGTRTIAEQLMRAKKRLRSLPNGGIGYGLLRYLGPEEIRERLRELPEAEIAVNYLGRMDLPSSGQSLFRQVDSPCGPTGSPSGRRRYLIDINGGVCQGSLQLAWAFSNNLHRRQTIERLEEDFRLALREMLVEESRADEVAMPCLTDSGCHDALRASPKLREECLR
jgi:non-ribosomal peptide synthase protein (TIGR01720 family)